MIGCIGKGIIPGSEAEKPKPQKPSSHVEPIGEPLLVNYVVDLGKSFNTQLLGYLVDSDNAEDEKRKELPQILRMSTERIAVMKFSALGDIAATLPMLRRMDSSPTIITSPLGHAFLKDEL